MGAPCATTWARASARSAGPKARQAAVGMPCRAQKALVNALEPSSRAAAAVGPNALMPAARSRSTSPSTSGTSGPTTTSPTPSARARATSPSMSSALTGTQRASAAMPALPGAHTTSLDQRRGGQRPAQRVLAPAAAHHQHLHPGVSRRSRGVPYHRCPRRAMRAKALDLLRGVGALERHQDDPIGAALVDQQIAVPSRPHVPDDAGIDVPDGMGQLWNFSVAGSKRTSVSGRMPNSLYQTMPSTTARA